MSLFRLEFCRICRSATYIAAITALVLIAYFQDVFPPSARIAAPGGTVEGLEACVLPAGEYALARDVDRFFWRARPPLCQPRGHGTGRALPLPAAALFWHDRHVCCAVLYARGVSSAKLVFCRAAALTAAMFLPVAVMALTLTSVAATDYGLANIDVLAYGKYALLWLLPTILLCTAIGALPTVLSGLPLGAPAMLLWGWAARNAPAFGYASLFAPRHEVLGGTARFLENLGALAQGRHCRHAPGAGAFRPHGARRGREAAGEGRCCRAKGVLRDG